MHSSGRPISSTDTGKFFCSCSSFLYDYITVLVDTIEIVVMHLCLFQELHSTFAFISYMLLTRVVKTLVIFHVGRDAEHG